MKILAFDTSTQSGSIALTEGERILGELTVTNVGTHSEWLLKNIADLLKDLKISLDDIDLFAVGVGPGSFTGLRIGVSVAKGLSWSTEKPLAGVSTMEALAMNLMDCSFPPSPLMGEGRGGGEKIFYVCPISDARKKEVYSALFRFNDSTIERLMDDCAISPEELLKVLKDKVSGSGKIIFMGNGVKIYESLIRENMDAVFADESLWHIKASNIAKIAQRDSFLRIEPAAMAPVYLRKSEPEMKGGG